MLRRNKQSKAKLIFALLYSNKWVDSFERRFFCENVGNPEQQKSDCHSQVSSPKISDWSWGPIDPQCGKR